MEDKQLLEAMAALLEPVTKRLDDIQSELSEVKATMATKEEMTRQNGETRILVENGYKRIENLLREDYGRVADAAAQGAAAAESQKELQSTVSDHDHALQNHNQRIAELERKEI